VKAKLKGGRPSKYNRLIAARICRAVSQGVSREGAAGLCGINPDTLYRWQREFPEFSESLKKSDSVFEAERVGNICNAGKSPKNWPANSWLLERKFPERYGRIDRHLIATNQPVSGPDRDRLNEAICRALGVVGPMIPITSGHSESRTNGSGKVVDVEEIESGQMLPDLP
jgi:transposase